MSFYDISRRGEKIIRQSQLWDCRPFIVTNKAKYERTKNGLWIRLAY